jgi:hypothetical protein
MHCRTAGLFSAACVFAIHATPPLFADDVITFRNGSQAKGEILGFEDGRLMAGIGSEVQRIFVRDIHSVRLDGKNDVMAVVMKNGSITEGDFSGIAEGKAKLTDGREIELKSVRDMFRIWKMATVVNGLEDEVRIGEWFVDDDTGKRYAVIIDKVGREHRMFNASRGGPGNPVALVELKDGVRFSVAGDPPDKYMEINKAGNLEMWLGKRKLATLRRFGLKD